MTVTRALTRAWRLRTRITMTRVVYAVDIKAPAEQVFAAVVDWRGQDRWIPLTTVRPGRQAGIAVGGEIAAWHRDRSDWFSRHDDDHRWDVPTRVDVVHTGSVGEGHRHHDGEASGLTSRASIGPKSSRFRRVVGRIAGS